MYTKHVGLSTFVRSKFLFGKSQKIKTLSLLLHFSIFSKITKLKSTCSHLHLQTLWKWKVQKCVMRFLILL